MYGLDAVDVADFPSFSEGLSLRASGKKNTPRKRSKFPFLFGGTFIEGTAAATSSGPCFLISLPFGRDFH